MKKKLRQTISIMLAMIMAVAFVQLAYQWLFPMWELTELRRSARTEMLTHTGKEVLAFVIAVYFITKTLKSLKKEKISRKQHMAVEV